MHAGGITAPYSAAAKPRQRREQDAAELLARFRIDDDDGFRMVAADGDGDAAAFHGDGTELLARRDGDARGAEIAGGERRAGGPLLLRAGEPPDEGRHHQHEGEDEKARHACHQEFQTAELLLRERLAFLRRLVPRILFR